MNVEEGKTEKAPCCATPSTGKGRCLLLASIALNLFLLGLAAGPVLSGRPMPPPPGPMEGGGPGMVPGFILDRLSRDLPQADAEKLRAIYADAATSMKGKREASHEAFQKIAAILKQEKPDLNALQAALETLQAEGKGFHDEMSKALTRVATEMPLESRQKIATFIEQGPMRHGRPGFMGKVFRGHGGPDRGPEGPHPDDQMPGDGKNAPDAPSDDPAPGPETP